MPDREAMTAILADFAKRNRRRLSQSDLCQIVDRILVASVRYDHYKALRAEWMDYKGRRKKLVSISEAAKDLEGGLGALDVITRDYLAIRLGPGVIEAAGVTLRRLRGAVDEVAGSIQEQGRRKDLALESWIGEMAEIFERAVGAQPTIWNSRRRGPFYELLQASRPRTFPPYGGLAASQVRKILADRSNG